MDMKLLHRCSSCSSGSGAMSHARRQFFQTCEVLRNRPSFLKQRNPFSSNKRSRQVPNTVTVDTAANGQSNSNNNSSTKIVLPPLKCPGGPRLKAEGLKALYKVPHAGILAQFDHRSILNLKLTHQIATKISQVSLKNRPDKVVLELGAGAGALTRSLLTRPIRGMLAVEKDVRFNPHLEQIRGYTKGKLQWVNADVLEMDEVRAIEDHFPGFVRQYRRRAPFSSGNASESGGDSKSEETYDAEAPLRSAERSRLLQKHHRSSLMEVPRTQQGGASASFSTSPNPALDIQTHWWSDGDAPLEVVANLPFSVITELLMRYAVDCSRRNGIFIFGRVPLHLFVQKEVSDIITAPPGSLAFSRLTVLSQAMFHVQLHQVFTEYTYYPKTEVLGALLTLEPRTVPLISPQGGGGTAMDGAVLIQFTDHLMKPGQRGSTIYKALHSFMPAELAQYVLQECCMDGSVSVLDLTVAEICTMAGMWAKFLTASQQNQQQQQR